MFFNLGMKTTLLFFTIVLFPILGLVDSYFTLRCFRRKYRKEIVEQLETFIKPASSYDIFPKVGSYRTYVQYSRCLPPALKPLAKRYFWLVWFNRLYWFVLIFSFVLFFSTMLFVSVASSHTDRLRLVTFPGLPILYCGAVILVVLNISVICGMLFHYYNKLIFCMGMLLSTPFLLDISWDLYPETEVSPTEVSGRFLSRTDAPQLWQEIDSIAHKLKIDSPKHLIIGLRPRFFTSIGTVNCQDGTVSGGTLFISYSLMAFLSKDELASIIAHELGHILCEDYNDPRN